MEELRRLESDEHVGPIAIEGLRPLLGPRDDLVILHLDPTERRYRTLGGTAPGVDDFEGALDDHVLLRSIDLLEPAVINPRDPRYPGDVHAHLRAGGVRRLIYLPLSSPPGEVRGGILVLRRNRPVRGVPRSARPLLDQLATTLRIRSLRLEAEEAKRREQAAGAAFELLIVSMHTLEDASSVDEVMGEVLRAVRNLDAGLIGAVVGVVRDGLISRVAAVGTTPRSAVEATQGTRLDGFPIGRQLTSERSSIFAGLTEVTHATRTKIMSPLGARSMLAAAGRWGGAVRIVISVYRSPTEPPPQWSLAALEVLLDHAAAILGRFEHRDWIETISETVQEAVVVYDRSGRVVYADTGAHELLPTGCSELGARLPVDAYTTRDGSDVEDADSPLSRALTGEPARKILRRRTTGAAHRLSARPLPGGGAVLTIRDVSSEVEEAEATPVLDLTEHRERRTP